MPKLKGGTLADEKQELEIARILGQCCLVAYRDYRQYLPEVKTEKKLEKLGLVHKYISVSNPPDYEEIETYKANTGPKGKGVPIATLAQIGEKGRKKWVVLCRGTQEDREWGKNLKATNTTYTILKAKYGKVHQGFYDIYRQFRNDLKNDIHKKVLPKTLIYVTGHSLGGALATLAAFDISMMVGRAYKVHMYNFGAPRVGQNTFYGHFMNKIKRAYRFVNSKDPVTAVPKWPYYHVGHRYQFKGKRILFQNHDMFYYNDVLNDNPEAYKFIK